jgi:hypothetical protein
MNILYLYADYAGTKDWNVARWRCEIPMKAFQKSYAHNARMMYVEDWANGKESENSEWADVIVVQRLAVGIALIAVEYWKARGKTLILDVDDAYHQIPKANAGHTYWKEGIVHYRVGEKLVPSKLKILPIEQLWWGGKLCHAVASPSRLLLEDWSEVVDKTILIPNYPDVNDYLKVVRPMPKGGEIIIGWGGGRSHNDSWKHSGVIPALIQLMLKRPQVRLCVAGGVEDILGLIRQRSPNARVFAKPWEEFSSWPPTLAQFQIGLIPLHGKYDDYRSPIKAIEYALMGIPWVGSSSPTLGGFRSYGRVVRNSKQEWYEALLDMVDNLQEYQDKQKEAFDLAVSMDIHKNLEYIASSYESCKQTLVERKAESTETQQEPF